MVDENEICDSKTEWAPQKLRSFLVLCILKQGIWETAYGCDGLHAKDKGIGG